MRKLITTLAMAGVLGLSAVSAATAAPVPGFEAQYNAVLGACAGAAANPEACEAAILAYSGALVAAGVAPAVALQSFTELRTEVAEAGGSLEVASLFEELLPESGAVGDNPSPTNPG
jgi:hypothetical protein